MYLRRHRNLNITVNYHHFSFFKYNGDGRGTGYAIEVCVFTELQLNYFDLFSYSYCCRQQSTGVLGQFTKQSSVKCNKVAVLAQLNNFNTDVELFSHLKLLTKFSCKFWGKLKLNISITQSFVSTPYEVCLHFVEKYKYYCYLYTKLKTKLIWNYRMSFVSINTKKRSYNNCFQTFVVPNIQNAI